MTADTCQLSPIVTVHVLLLDEGSETWRPVSARRIRGDVYLLIGPQEDEDEHWQFPVGAQVRVEVRQLSGGERLVAVGSLD
jgi:hypothetical protein